MNRIFSYDSKFSRVVIKLCYACFLNLLWMLCSIPIITIGASTTALWYAGLKIIREQEYNAAGLFFRSFKQNFKQATVLWLILFAAGIFLGGISGSCCTSARQPPVPPLFSGPFCWRW